MTEPFDFSTLQAEDATPQSPSVTPDHTASKPQGNRKWGRPRSAPSEPKATPRAGRPRKEKPKTISPMPPKRKGQFVEPLTQFYTAIGIAVFVRDPVCGNAIVEAAPQCAIQIDELAYQNDAVRRVIWNAMQVGTVGKIIAAHMPIILAVLAHHVPKMRDLLGVIEMTFKPTAPEDTAEGTQSDAA